MSKAEGVTPNRCSRPAASLATTGLLWGMHELCQSTPYRLTPHELSSTSTRRHDGADACRSSRMQKLALIVLACNNPPGPWPTAACSSNPPAAPCLADGDLAMSANLAPVDAQSISLACIHGLAVRVSVAAAVATQPIDACAVSAAAERQSWRIRPSGSLPAFW